MNLTSIIILNYGDEEDTATCIDSIIKHTASAQYELIVVNNGSCYKTNWPAKYPGQKVRVLFNNRNLGFAEGSNHAANIAKGNFLLFLNNDTIFIEPVLEPLLKVFQKEADALNPVILYSNSSKIWFSGAGYNFFTGQTRHFSDGKSRETSLLTGCALYLPKTVFLQVRGFREDYFCYYEDSDLSFRLKRLGLHLRVSDATRIWHKVSVSSGGELNHIAQYYLTRNNLLFNRRFNPYFLVIFYYISLFNFYKLLKFVFIKHEPKKAIAILKGSFDFLINRFGKLNSD